MRRKRSPVHAPADATKYAAWVVDGATGVSDLPPLVPDLTDAAWLAGQLNNGSSRNRVGELRGKHRWKPRGYWLSGISEGARIGNVMLEWPIL